MMIIIKSKSKHRALATASISVLLLLIALAVSQSPDRPAALSFSDPANVTQPSAQAIGFPSRDPGFDAWPGFQSPPPGYGEAAFFWWLGDPLTKERLTWHLDKLAGKGIGGLQINYAHTDRGGVSYGLSMKSDPPIFSPAWWGRVQWFAGEAGKRGMTFNRLARRMISACTAGIWTGRSTIALAQACTQYFSGHRAPHTPPRGSAPMI
ncbi:MAG: hypothetical protein Q8N56_00635, partial [bacterium]|nr:hypothetical protein [bacterium]